MAKPAANADTVRTEFIKEGIPDEVVTKALKSYPFYLRWPVQTKLRPALQLWLKHLGSQQLSARLDKNPKLLLRIPEECKDVYLYLVAKGVDAERIQQRFPQVMARPLSKVQSTVQFIQQQLRLKDEQLPAYFDRHYMSLQYTPVRVARTLQAVAELLAVPVASHEVQEVLMACHYKLFRATPDVLHHRVSFFCQEFQGGQRVAKTALKQSVYLLSVDLIRSRAAELKTMLDWTEDELHRHVSNCPMILSYKPSTVVSNIQKLQTHNFSSPQALEICTSLPSLTGYDWSSLLNVEKLQYLTIVLQVSLGKLASKSRLLGSSLEYRIGPRSEFLYRSKALSPDTPLVSSRLSSWIEKGSDAAFAARFNKPSFSPPLMYDVDFKQHWLQRWTFMRQEMRLSIADISACRSLLYVSLPNTLAPRWRYLTLLEAAQAGFKATDHLTALATLSDEHFAETTRMADEGLVYDRIVCNSPIIQVC